MSYRFVHVGINFGDPLKNPAYLRTTWDYVSPDWIQYTRANWILWTNVSLGTCNQALKDALTLNDQFLIFEMPESLRDGFHYEFVWRWLTKPRNPFTGAVLEPSPTGTLPLFNPPFRRDE